MPSPTMTKEEAIEMMRRCRNEIAQLRAENAALAPKADAYDTLAAVVNLLPKPSQGMAEDLVWRLDKRIKELMAPPSADLDDDPTPRF